MTRALLLIAALGLAAADGGPSDAGMIFRNYPDGGWDNLVVDEIRLSQLFRPTDAIEVRGFNGHVEHYRIDYDGGRLLFVDGGPVSGRSP